MKVFFARRASCSYCKIESSQNEHHAIFEAVKKKDSAASQKYLATHLKNVKHHILQGFEEQSNKPEKNIIKYQSFEDIKTGNISLTVAYYIPSFGNSNRFNTLEIAARWSFGEGH